MAGKWPVAADYWTAVAAGSSANKSSGCAQGNEGQGNSCRRRDPHQCEFGPVLAPVMPSKWCGALPTQ